MIRVTATRNAAEPPLGKKVQFNPEKDSFDDFLLKCSNKLGFKAKKIFDSEGSVLERIGHLRNDDVVYVSEGEPFALINKRPGSGGSKLVRKMSEESSALSRKVIYKIAVLGESSVGKSAITCRYVFKKFIREYTSTIEDFYTKRSVIDSEMVELDIIDTAGMEEFRVVRDAMIKDREGFLMIFDVTQYESFERVEYFYNLIKMYHLISDDVPCVLVGNKIDKEKDRVVTKEQAEKLAAQYNSVYVECSALSGERIDDAFSELVRMLR